MNGALAMHGILDAIFTTFKDIPNTIPEHQGITSSQMVAYLIYWIVQLPFLFIPPSQLKWLFTLKAILVPIVALGTMGYMVNKGGSGPLISSTEEASGKSYAQAWLLGLASVTGNWATLALNMPDFTRHSSSKGSQWWQMLAIPLWGTALSLCAIFSASASITVYGGSAMWYVRPCSMSAPAESIIMLGASLILSTRYVPVCITKNNHFSLLKQWNSRAARFFACLAWVVAVIGANITANTLSAGNDLTTLLSVQ